jgi:hypothetical protein
MADFKINLGKLNKVIYHFKTMNQSFRQYKSSIFYDTLFKALLV